MPPKKTGGSAQIYNTTGLINNQGYTVTGNQYSIQQPLFANIKGGAKNIVTKKKTTKKKPVK
jgi:hypothetical protein